MLEKLSQAVRRLAATLLPTQAHQKFLSDLHQDERKKSARVQLDALRPKYPWMNDAILTLFRPGEKGDQDLLLIILETTQIKPDLGRVYFNLNPNQKTGAEVRVYSLAEFRTQAIQMTGDHRHPGLGCMDPEGIPALARAQYLTGDYRLLNEIQKTARRILRTTPKTISIEEAEQALQEQGQQWNRSGMYPDDAMTYLLRLTQIMQQLHPLHKPHGWANLVEEMSEMNREIGAMSQNETLGTDIIARVDNALWNVGVLIKQPKALPHQNRP